MTPDEQAEAMQEYYYRSRGEKGNYSKVSTEIIKNWRNEMLDEEKNVTESNSLYNHKAWEEIDKWKKK
jgi:hypothetical protein